MKTKKNVSKIKYDIYKWLIRLGVHEGNINISFNNSKSSSATVKYSFNNQEYNLSTSKKREYRDNLHNIELLVHSRVLGIERGVETLEQAFSGYKALPEPRKQTPRLELNLPESATFEECKKCYKGLMKVYHPDVCGGKRTEKFNVIQNAFKEIKREHNIQ